MTPYTELSVGRETDSPQYTKEKFTTRSQKNARLTTDSSSFSRGLHESWEWYDKCAKRNRLGKLYQLENNQVKHNRES